MAASDPASLRTSSGNLQDAMTVEWPLISIITVVLNGEQSFSRTMTSVIEQAYRNYELIVIDGGSTDGTLRLIKENAKHIKYWSSAPDNGIYDAMNNAIKQCNGDYIYFLNCGDCFTGAHTLGDVVEIIKKETPDILCGNVSEIHESGTILFRYEIDSEYQLYQETICHQALFTAKRVFDEVGNFNIDYRISADRDWLLRALKIYKCKIFYADAPICIFDVTGVSSRQRMRLRMENLAINHKYFRWKFYPFLLKQLADKIFRRSTRASASEPNP